MLQLVSRAAQQDLRLPEIEVHFSLALGDRHQHLRHVFVEVEHELLFDGSLSAGDGHTVYQLVEDSADLCWPGFQSFQ